MAHTTPALRLASWIRAHDAAPDALTHLKLQKLSFYAWGIGAALGYIDELGDVSFEPWEHGPVNRTIWARYRQHGSGPIATGPTIEATGTPLRPSNACAMCSLCTAA